MVSIGGWVDGEEKWFEGLSSRNVFQLFQQAPPQALKAVEAGNRETKGVPDAKISGGS